MAYVLAFHKVDNVFAYVFRVIANPLEGPGGPQHVQGAVQVGGIVAHGLSAPLHDLIVRGINMGIRLNHSDRALRIQAGERVQRIAQYRSHHRGQIAEVRVLVARELQMRNGLGHLGDAPRLIADPL